MSKTLYISDLDGTLLSPEGVLSQSTVTLLNHAIARGARVSIATARTPATVSRLMRDVNFRLPLLVMTGAALWDKNTGEYSDVQFFETEQVGEIISAYTAPEGGGAFLYTLTGKEEESIHRELMKIYHVGPLNELERGFMMERIASPFKRFIVPESGLSDLPEKIENAVLFFGMRPNAVAEEIRYGLNRIEGINPMSYHDWYGDEITEIEAFPRGATKAKAIHRLKRRIGANRVVVFGDNLNDLSMMSIADWSVAVSNAVPQVKDAADEVIGSNSADAVARYILSDLTES